MRRNALARACALGVTAVFVAATPAVAVPNVGKYGRAIDPIAGYDGASKCDPDPEPGVVAFQQMVMRAYPDTGAGSISRACSGSVTSEHHEGRAWDWGVNAGVPWQKKQADELIEWLIKEDRYGNPRANARRTGIMYLIWDRRIWFPWSGWEVYCEQRKRGCVDPDDGGLRSPHTDHVHFSFTWAGARKKTTMWNRSRSYISAIEPERTGAGYWLLGRNGAVFAEDAGYYGGMAERFPKKAYVAVAAVPGGNGYWMLNSAGAVKAMGAAQHRGDVSDRNTRAVDIEAAPTGSGYWIVTKKGRVFAFGSAGHFGDPRERDAEVIAMTVTPSGRGYWLLTTGGRVFSYGDAANLADFEGDATAVDIAASPGGGGYWIVTEEGRVKAVGDAAHFGDLSDRALGSPVGGIAPTPTGNGYWLVTKLGSVFRFGDAA